MRHPTAGIKRFKMRTRERFLTPEERQRVHEAIQAGLQIPQGRKGHLETRSVWALQLLSLTGLRRDEIRDLTWPMIDWQHACLRLPDTQTGLRIVHLPSHVTALRHHIHGQSGNPGRAASSARAPARRSRASTTPGTPCASRSASPTSASTTSATRSPATR